MPSYVLCLGVVVLGVDYDAAERSYAWLARAVLDGGAARARTFAVNENASCNAVMLAAAACCFPSVT
jgi:hypothetical protein